MLAVSMPTAFTLFSAEPPCRVGMDAREVQLRYGCLAALGRAEVALGVGPALRVVGANQDDDITKRAVGLLPGSEVGHGDLIVGLASRTRRRRRRPRRGRRGSPAEPARRSSAPSRSAWARRGACRRVRTPKSCWTRSNSPEVSSRRPRRRGGRSRPSARRSRRRCTRGTGRRPLVRVSALRRRPLMRRRARPCEQHHADDRHNVRCHHSSHPRTSAPLHPCHPLPLLRLLLRDEGARLLDHIVGNAHVAAIGVVHEAVADAGRLELLDEVHRLLYGHRLVIVRVDDQDGLGRRRSRGSSATPGGARLRRCPPTGVHRLPHDSVLTS